MNEEKLSKSAYKRIQARRRKRGWPQIIWRKEMQEAMKKGQLAEGVWAENGLRQFVELITNVYFT
mgnify:CR=1 FL=1